MLKIIIYIIVFYFIYKAAKFFVRYLLSSKRSSNFKKNYPKKNKYQNVEEAEFKEIPDENGNQKKESQ